MIKITYRFIVVFDILLLLSIPLLPPQLSVPDLLLFGAIGFVLYIVSGVGLLMLKRWGYFTYLVVFLANVGFVAAFYPFADPQLLLSDIVGLIDVVIGILILGLPLANKCLKKEFFGE